MFRITAFKRALSLAFSLLMSVTLSACASNTDRELLQAQIHLYDQSLGTSQKVLQDLQAGYPKADFRAYVSFASLNSVLAKLQGYSFQVPSDDSVHVTLDTLKISTLGAQPSIEIRASATKDQLKIAVESVAVLVPQKEFGTFKLEVLYFVPKVSWTWIEFTKARLVRELVELKVIQIADQLPLIELPLTNEVKLGSPATQIDVTTKVSDRPAYLTTRISVPTTQVSRHLVLTKVLFIRDGIYLFGDAR